jgi:ppGpp synthetase/RelA/SpoT-type nucleotidyltranferase
MYKFNTSERLELERRLHEPGRRTRLHRVQDIVRSELEKFREQCEALVIRSVVPRSHIKELTSVIAKIESLHPKGGPRYALALIHDLVGVKVLCPYPSDVNAVNRWLLQHEGFKVTPRSEAKARILKVTGYQGYHFSVQLAGGLLLKNEDLSRIKCEVQVKTMLEEAWDAKTHDVVYKRAQHVSPDLLVQMKLVSDSLQELDKESENLKNLILQRERQERQRKEAAAAMHLQKSMKLRDEVRRRFPKAAKVLRAGVFNATNVLDLIPMVEYYCEKGRLSPEVCRLAGLVGLYATGRHLDIWALEVCDELIRRNEKDLKALLTYGSVCWALNRYDDAIEMTEKAIRRATEKADKELVTKGKANCAYWIADKAWAEKGIDKGLARRAKQYIEDALKAIHDRPAYLDTKGYILITTGSREEINEGIKLITQAFRKASKRTYSVARVFYERHQTIARARLLALKAKKATR